MTISSTVRKAGPYSGTGVVVPYPFAFKVFTSADVLVVKTPATVGAADVVLALTTDYTVALNADQNVNPGGSVTLVVALAAGEKLTVNSNVQALQPAAFTMGGGFYPSVVEDALDRMAILAQQAANPVSVTGNTGGGAVPLSTVAVLPSSVTGVNATLPVPVAGQLLAWNSTATGLVGAPPSSGGGGVTPITGTFTPTVTYANLPPAAYLVQQGSYIIYGPLVFFTLDIGFTCPATPFTGGLIVYGLPVWGTSSYAVSTVSVGGSSGVDPITGNPGFDAVSSSYGGGSVVMRNALHLELAGAANNNMYLTITGTVPLV